MRFVALPNPAPGMRAWGADAGDYHFVITNEDGSTLISDADRKEWVGYTASFKSRDDSKFVLVAGLWQSFTDAENACRDTLRLLRMRIKI